MMWITKYQCTLILGTGRYIASTHHISYPWSKKTPSFPKPHSWSQQIKCPINEEIFAIISSLCQHFSQVHKLQRTSHWLSTLNTVAQCLFTSLALTLNSSCSRLSLPPMLSPKTQQSWALHFPLYGSLSPTSSIG